MRLELFLIIWIQSELKEWTEWLTKSRILLFSLYHKFNYAGNIIIRYLFLIMIASNPIKFAAMVQRTGEYLMDTFNYYTTPKKNGKFT
jgi:hypothetical protein